MVTPAIINGPDIHSLVSKDTPAQEYKITLEQPGNIVLSLDGLSGNADLVLLDESKSAMTLFNQDMVASRNPDMLPEFINFTDFALPLHKSVASVLKPGAYYVQVALGEGAERAEFTLHIADDTKPLTSLELGSLPDGPFSYRGLTTDTVEYSFTVEKKTAYNFMAASADPEIEPTLVLKSKTGKTVKGVPMKDVPYKVMEIKEQPLDPGAYTLVVQAPKGKSMKFALSGISKVKQDKLQAEQEKLQKEFQAQLEKARKEADKPSAVSQNK